jgi:hypothetical protein
MRRELAHYGLNGLSAVLYPVAIISAVGLADDCAGDTAISAASAAPDEPTT